VLRRRRIELVWGLFAALNLALMPFGGDWETVPFHFIWVSLTLLYGFRVWRPKPTALVLGAVVGITFTMLLVMADLGEVSLAESTEVPLMSAMFLAMVWHARRRQAALEEVHRAADRERDFLRDASHQLRTPITIARGHAELIRADCAGRQSVADADVVLDELEKLARISERLLLLAAIEHPDFLRRTPIDFGRLVGGTAQRWSASARRRWAIDVRAEGCISADPERLASALDALIENAVKYTNEADTILVSAHSIGGTAVIEVRDTGPGIAPDDVGRIFERFARGGDGSRGGTGLGLPIVKAIVEAHGGSVGVQRLAEGVVFRVQLPGFRPTQASPVRIPAAAIAR
jgi:two-component system OmpR family sensor kinase